MMAMGDFCPDVRIAHPVSNYPPLPLRRQRRQDFYEEEKLLIHDVDVLLIWQLIWRLHRRTGATSKRGRSAGRKMLATQLLA
jgi:hypothetical protein